MRENWAQNPHSCHFDWNLLDLPCVKSLLSAPNGTTSCRLPCWHFSVANNCYSRPERLLALLREAPLAPPLSSSGHIKSPRNGFSYSSLSSIFHPSIHFARLLVIHRISDVCSVLAPVSDLILRRLHSSPERPLQRTHVGPFSPHLYLLVHSYQWRWAGVTGR